METETLQEVIRRGLAKCRHREAPVSLIAEHDMLHVTHMVAAEVAPALAEHDRMVRAEAWDEGVRTALSLAVRNDDGVTLSLDQANPYRD